MYYRLLLGKVLLVIFEAFFSGVNISRCLLSEILWSENLAPQRLLPKRPLATLSKVFLGTFPGFCFRNIPFSKALRTFCLPLRSIIAFSVVSILFSFLTGSLGFVDYLKISISFFNLICSSSASSSDNHCYKFPFQKIFFSLNF